MGGSRGAGRPRDNSIDPAILNAAVARLMNDGYDRMTVDDVARDAGVTRPTVYLRWPSKHELAMAAVESVISPSQLEPSGDVRADLLDIANSIFDKIEASMSNEFVKNPYMGLLGTALIERRRHPEIYEHYKDRLIEPRRKSIREVLERGISNGTLRHDIDIEVVISMFVGFFYAKSIAEHWGTDKDWPHRVVDSTMAIISK